MLPLGQGKSARAGTRFAAAVLRGAKGAVSTISSEVVAMVVRELPAGAALGAGVLRGMLAGCRAAPGLGTGICSYFPWGNEAGPKLPLAADS